MSVIVQWLSHSLVLLTLGLEWELTFSNPEATAGSSRFADILNVTPWWHHPLGFWIVLLEFHHTTHFINSRPLLRPSWLHFPECLPLGGWPHHCSNLVHLDLFLYSSSMYSFQLFLIASARSLPSMSFIVPIFGQNVPLILPVFLESSLAFPLLWFCLS